MQVPIQREMNNMRVRKLSLEMLGWSRDESRFAMEGRLVFAHVTADTNWRAKWKGTVNSGLKLLAANAFIGNQSTPPHFGSGLNSDPVHSGIATPNADCP